MDIQALIEKWKDDPKMAENAEYFREMLDSSEAADSEHLKSFVEELMKKPEFGTRAEVPEDKD